MSSSSSSYFALHSGLTAARRLGINITRPLALCQRMDGRLGLFSENGIMPSASSSINNNNNIRDDNSNAIMSVPLSSTLHRFQRNFTPSPQNWRSAAAVASTCNFPVYFETKLDLSGSAEDAPLDKDEVNPAYQQTVDEQQAVLQRRSANLQERKWLEGSAALFLSSAVVLAERQRKISRFLPTDGSSDRAVIEVMDWAFNNHFPGFNVEVDEKGQHAPQSMDEVEARYNIMQACSHLEASLMDAVSTCDINLAQDLFGERAEAPQTFTEVVAKAVETTVFGGIFAVPFRSREEMQARAKHTIHISNASVQKSFLSGLDPRYCTPLFYYAPYLSNINTAVDPWDANCVIDRTRDGFLVLKVLKPIKAGEELVKLEPRV